MSEITFENYGKLAGLNLTSTETSGRYPSQADSERSIILDVVRKLDICSTDTVLDIGCGCGLLLLPLSFMVRYCCGVDHPSVVSKLSTRLSCENIRLHGANFLQLTLDEKFSKILCYGVLQNLSSYDEVCELVDRALSFLKPGGKILFGDISNTDKKRRFQSTEKGAAFEAEWARSSGSSTSYDPLLLTVDPLRVEFTDQLVLRLILHIRSRGYNAYVMDQPSSLPWGFTREDILVTC